jgi:heptosyltransferase-3
MNILCIRGGALGDLIVTLPTLRLLRERWPDAHIEILGHPRLAEIAVNRFYLNASRSVNHRTLSAFFTPHAVLDPEWMDYIGDFELVLSYFYDPDGLFLENLKRCKPVEVLTYAPRVPADFGRPAARHFAGMVEPLGLALGADASSEVFPSPDDIDGARAFLEGVKPGTRLVAIHPGSGGETKNWPKEQWAELGPAARAGSSGDDAAVDRGRGGRGAGRFYRDGVEGCPARTRAIIAAADPGRASA